LSFWIVTGPVRTGKTTALGRWLKQYDKAGGFLTPDGADGLRLFYDVGNDELLPFEVGDGALVEEIIEVGRFRFYKSAFDRGNDLLLQAERTDAEVIVLDEWGKLELRGKGFAKGAEYIVKKALIGSLAADLVVVVRDYLVDDFQTWYTSLIPEEEVVCSPKILDLPTE
jgi:nucleoside-triphosphatase